MNCRSFEACLSKVLVLVVWWWFSFLVFQLLSAGQGLNERSWSHAGQLCSSLGFLNSNSLNSPMVIVLAKEEWNSYCLVWVQVFLNSWSGSVRCYVVPSILDLLILDCDHGLLSMDS